jgi:hypothetical protein
MKRLTLLSFIFSLAFAGAVDAQEKDTVKTVKTLPGAYFNSSCGNDRLGGSKMGFISEDVVLEVEHATEEGSVEDNKTLSTLLNEVSIYFS